MCKRQRSDYKDEGASSTESNDDSLSPSKMLGGEVCSHIQKGIDLPTIRKQIKTQGYRSTCKLCDQNPSTKGSESTNSITTEGPDADNALWLCLKCGSQLCGRNRNQHALLHYQTPRSDMHALVMNTTTFAVWCYFCNLSVEPYAKPKLLDIVEFAKRESMKVRTASSMDKATNDVTNEQIQITTESVRKMMIDALHTTAPIVESCNTNDTKRLDKNGSAVGVCSSSSGAYTADKPQLQIMPYTKDHNTAYTTASTSNGRAVGALALQKSALDSLPRVRGLANLHNTCFFNAVLQCLARTPYLLPILQQSAVEGERVVIPGGVLRLADGTDTILPPIEGELDTWRSLTDALASLLAEMTSGADGVLTPKRLLHELTSKWPQFDGGDQHDSHELLRHLLESVRTDDLRRYQVLILQSLGLDKHKSQQNVDEMRKAMAKFYGKQISQWVFRPEQVFRGSLVSTLTCQDCHNTSSRHEYFLDISLPVCVEKPQPPVRRKSSPEPQSQSEQSTLLATVSSSGAPKMSSKREREREKKAKRMAKHKKNRINLSSVGASPMYSSLSAAEQANATSAKANDDEEDEDDDDGGGMGRIVPLTDVAAPTPHSEASVAGEDGCLSSDGCNEPSDADVEDNDVTDDPLSKGGATRSLVGPACVDQNGNHTGRLEVGRAIGPEKLDDTPENSNKEREIKVICAVSMSAERSAQIAKQLHCLKESGALPVIEQQYGTEDLLAKRKAAAGVVAGQWQRQRTYSYADWSNTIAPRYQCEDGEYSVQSCFNNFTAVELMTGNNKVTCDACTERINGKGGKDVKTNATKQYLISVPPAVLILHLKRFQAGLRGMSRKLTKPVAFPFVLDIAPFCGSKVKRAAHIRPGQKKILYALYGIVEHSGSMHAGHYVAYVKVRPSFGPDDERWKFIPQGTKDELDSRSEQEMAKEQALRMGPAAAIGCCPPSTDSDDSASCCSNLDDDDASSSEPENRPTLQRQKTGKEKEQEEEEEDGIGSRAKTATTNVHADITPPPPGKWYHVSDSFVREVSEDTVAKVQAYFLFYERIF
ncbi:ubiquitin carboxyl-terminal hydrolase 16-like [Anopheles albimanus]|uniref:ubiquitin carboxyl-terminal hydrolase 16-like n=1 Tax=Anopheles albimanus TaxID=7167 RepID=UPI00164051FD|nr:ubiquitin carboxyl-terminal hydrolase 16-like [Anopheles albimanus]